VDGRQAALFGEEDLERLGLAQALRRRRVLLELRQLFETPRRGAALGGEGSGGGAVAPPTVTQALRASPGASRGPPCLPGAAPAPATAILAPGRANRPLSAGAGAAARSCASGQVRMPARSERDWQGSAVSSARASSQDGGSRDAGVVASDGSVVLAEAGLVGHRVTQARVLAAAEEVLRGRLLALDGTVGGEREMLLRELGLLQWSRQSLLKTQLWETAARRDEARCESEALQQELQAVQRACGALVGEFGGQVVRACVQTEESLRSKVSRTHQKRQNYEALGARCSAKLVEVTAQRDDLAKALQLAPKRLEAERAGCDAHLASMISHRDELREQLRLKKSASRRVDQECHRVRRKLGQALAYCQQAARREAASSVDSAAAESQPSSAGEGEGESASAVSASNFPVA